MKWVKGILFLLSIILLFLFAAYALQRGSEDVPLAGAAPSVAVNGKTIEFPYTDDNFGEDLLIYTDREEYHELSTITVYAAVVNASGKTQNVSLQAYTNGRQITEVSRLVKDIPYNVDVPVFDELETCEPGVNTETGERTENCHKKQSGTRQEQRFRDEWQAVALENPKERPADSKEVKGEVSRAITTPVSKNQTSYYKITFKIPPNVGREEFYLEAIGDQGGKGVLR